MKTVASLRWHLLAVAVLAAALGFGPPAARAVEEAPGTAVFVAKGCAICHEERAVLQAPHVTSLRRDRPFFELAAAMWNHAPLMWANLSEPGVRWPLLTPREMADLASYLNGSAPRDLPPNRSLGQVVLLEKGCLACHPWGSPGPATAKGLAGRFRLDSDAAWAAAMWNHAPTMLALAAERRGEYPHFKPKEMVDLVEFLRQMSKPH